MSLTSIMRRQNLGAGFASAHARRRRPRIADDFGPSRTDRSMARSMPSFTAGPTPSGRTRPIPPLWPSFHARSTATALLREAFDVPPTKWHGPLRERSVRSRHRMQYRSSAGEPGFGALTRVHRIAPYLTWGGLRRDEYGQSEIPARPASRWPAALTSSHPAIAQDRLDWGWGRPLARLRVVGAVFPMFVRNEAHQSRPRVRHAQFRQR